MEVTMKSSYSARNGHPKTRFCKASNNVAATERRERALSRLMYQLQTGKKFRSVGDKEGVDLTDDDLLRIKDEVKTLESKIKLGKS